MKKPLKIHKKVKEKTKPPKRLQMEAKELKKKLEIQAQKLVVQKEKQIEKLDKQLRLETKRKTMLQFQDDLRIQKEAKQAIHKQLLLEHKKMAIEDSKYEDRQLFISTVRNLAKIHQVKGWVQNSVDEMICLTNLEIVENGKKYQGQKFHLDHVLIPIHTFGRKNKDIINECLITETQKQIEFGATVKIYKRADGTKDFGLRTSKREQKNGKYPLTTY